MDGLDAPLVFTGSLFVLRFHWIWMLVALGLGAWVGWRSAGAAPATPPRNGA